jgi:hypothetical protein
MQTVFLGAIAVATVLMALVQVGIIVYGARLARRVDQLVTVIETEIKPALGRVNDMSGDINRATSLAVAQVERADELFAKVADRVDRVTLVAQDAVVEPFRHGAALLQGVRVAIAVLREASGPSGPSTAPAGPVADDEETLFIG